MSIAVVLPSRGRPEQARRAIQSMRDTAILVNTRLILAVDRDDPALPDYLALRWPGDYAAEVTRIVLDKDETGNLTKATNAVSMRVAQDPTTIIGNVGDDQIARTNGWDRMVREAMRKPGFVYGNDLFQGQALPCGGIFIHAQIVLALGWYALPRCEHLFIDNAWATLGQHLKRLTYLPEMVFEHMHPLAGKAEWDEGYERANNQEIVDRDRVAYEDWRDNGDLLVDLRRVNKALQHNPYAEPGHDCFAMNCAGWSA